MAISFHSTQGCQNGGSIRSQISSKHLSHLIKLDFPLVGLANSMLVLRPIRGRSDTAKIYR